MTVIIPVLNEEQAIGRVLSAIPQWVSDAIVVDNGSTDRTADVARAHGGRIVHEPRRGYGSACLAGLAAVRDAEVIVFLDGDFSDYPEQMAGLVEPILANQADLVIGSRTRGHRQPGALTLPQRFGNALACGLVRLLWGTPCTDLGPFRAIRLSALRSLDVDDRTFGWTIQMQIRAASRGLRTMEIPVSYRPRIGRSKISGTFRGVVAAGTKILSTIVYEAIAPSPARREQLVVFTRYPKPGFTKTRLIPLVGAEGAATIQRQMTRHTLASARSLRSARRGARVEIRYSGGTREQMGEMFGQRLRFAPQGAGDLGQRLTRAVGDAFVRQAGAAVVIGSDCPEIGAQLLNQAFDTLRHHDVVLGPATDGGYYLIGLRCSWPALFQTIDWGTHQVLQQTLSAASRLQLTVVQLPVLQDVDRPEDIAVWERVRQNHTASTISVIIPTLNEQEQVAQAIASARATDDVEIIVVDGGSSDRTVEIARSCGVTVIQSLRGRARQMNRGAAAATGDVLLFLHADSRLPVDYVQEVARIVAIPRTAAGAFLLRIEPSNLTMRLFALTTNFRSRVMQLPYGDQAIFLTRKNFRRVKGFAELPIMEDVEIIRQLLRFGSIRIATGHVSTSARRWQSNGAWRMTFLNQCLLLAHHCGVSSTRLYQWRETGSIVWIKVDSA